MKSTNEIVRSSLLVSAIAMYPSQWQGDAHPCLETAPSFNASVATTSANWPRCFTAEVASSSAAKDSCKLQAVSFPSRHLRDFTKIVTRTCLSNFGDLTTCQDRSGDFDLSGVQSTLRSRLPWTLRRGVFVCSGQKHRTQDSSLVFSLFAEPIGKLPTAANDRRAISPT